MSEQIKEGNGAAFPCEQHELSDNSWNQTFDPGMTLRQYAAIKLRVPESGDDWLDDMIRKSLRDEFAAKALNGVIACFKDHAGATTVETRCHKAYEYADAMLRASEQQP